MEPKVIFFVALMIGLFPDPIIFKNSENLFFNEWLFFKRYIMYYWGMGLAKQVFFLVVVLLVNFVSSAMFLTDIIEQGHCSKRFFLKNGLQHVINISPVFQFGILN